ncbi:MULTISPECIES: GntR family transcriptional regulator [Metabacillus]|uniref:GntR family transcriptional regulator n=3 Tax=Metabacillus TaxID=2675233 RepID=A0A179SSJ1_9BACI|nr:MULTISPECIES: GntR family transcriptional regulator [Metabacillus]OAS84746.1 GntR family transcriptional regulator [Metabacillus litoralis]QNF30856.1 GntR family transcriptional regulator [Metabacillus sp. KUDC1714]
MIETSALATQIYKVLRKEIISGIFAPGDKLDINELANKYGVSRSPVKEAVNQLVHEGLIEILPRKGTYITQLRFKDCMEALDARFMVETWAAAQAVKLVSDEQIGNWNQIIKKMDALLVVQPFSYEAYSKLDMEFHQLLVQWTMNQKVQNIYYSINPLISLARVGYSEVFEHSLKRHKDHHNMLEALKNRDLSSLIDALQQHNHTLKEDTKLHWNEQLYGPIDESN